MPFQPFPAVPELERIWLLLQHRRYELAETAARSRLSINPSDWRAYVLLAHAYRFLGRLAEARQAATTAIGLEPESSVAHFALARVYGQQGLFERAHQAAIEALRRDPRSAECLGYRAQLFYLSGSYNAAIALAEDGLRCDARQPDCLLWRALAQEGKNQLQAADADFNHLLGLTPNSALLHEKLGQLLLRRYAPHPAALHLSEALRLAPDNYSLPPLLRQARRQQWWPGWLLLLHQQRQQDWSSGLLLSWRGPVVSLLTPGFELYSWWQLRRDPLFRFKVLTPAQRRARLRQWLLPLVVLAALLLMAYCLHREEVSLFTLLLPIAVLLAGWMRRPAPR